MRIRTFPSAGTPFEGDWPVAQTRRPTTSEKARENRSELIPLLLDRCLISTGEANWLISAVTGMLPGRQSLPVARKVVEVNAQRKLETPLWYEARVSPNERLAELREVPLFAELEQEALERILAASSELECPAGQVLMRAGDRGVGMFVVEEGTVVVEAPGHTIDLGRGEFVGELSLLVPESTRVARVRAKTPVRCLALNRATLEDLLESEPRFAVTMLRLVAARLWKVMQA